MFRPVESEHMRAWLGADERIQDDLAGVKISYSMGSATPNPEGCFVFPPPLVEGQQSTVILRQCRQSEPFFRAELFAVRVNGRLRWAVLERTVRAEKRVDNLFPGHKTLTLK
jgi:hypothetical protein